LRAKGHTYRSNLKRQGGTVRRFRPAGGSPGEAAARPTAVRSAPNAAPTTPNLRPPLSARRAAAAPRPHHPITLSPYHPDAFTIVELIVVITIMALILGIAVPGLSAIAAESRFSAAVQITNGALTRAYTSALADLNMTAVRFVPGKWDNDPTTAADQSSTAGRQHIVTYSYTPTTAADPANPGTVAFGEYFQRQTGTPSVVLPEDIFAAPLEALDKGARTIPIKGDSAHQFSPFGAQFLLAADPRSAAFTVDAADMTQNFHQADDFLIIFDPRLGMRSVIAPNRIRAFIPLPTPADGYDAAQDKNDHNVLFQRYNFTGVTLYHRSTFLKATDGGDAQDRQNWLRDKSRPYLVHRFGGGLVMGTQAPGTE
jgi:type II secretory pathway pseudopilin PulG